MTDAPASQPDTPHSDRPRVHDLPPDPAAGSLLVVGADGLLGGSLVDLGRRDHQPVHGTTLLPASPPAPDLAPLDLTRPLDGWTPPPGVRSAILCAAITRLDACRNDPAGSRLINVDRTLELARRLTDAGVFVTFISSNLVFDGTLPRLAADAPFRPQTEYGRQKAEVETALRELPRPLTAVVRLTKVLHSKWPLVQGWLDALRAGRPVQAFADFVCAPIPLALVVRGLNAVSRGRRSGTWQFSADTDVSYADIARHLARGIGAPESLVEAVPSDTRTNLEHNPAHTTLDASRARSELGLAFPPPLATVEQAFLP